MKTFTTLLLSLISFSLFSQELEKTFQPHLFSESSAIEVVDSTIFINIKEDSPFSVAWGNQKIYKLNYNLDLLDSLDLSSFDPSYTPFVTQIIEITKIGTDSLGILINTYGDSAVIGGTRYLGNCHIVIVDTDFNLLSVETYGDYYFRYYGNHLRRIEDHLYLTGHHYDIENDTNTPFIFRLDLNGLAIDSGLISTTNHFPVVGFRTSFVHVEKVGNRFLVGIDDIGQWGHIIGILNSNLNFLEKWTFYPSEHGIPDLYFGNPGIIKYLNDSSVFAINTGFTYRKDPSNIGNNSFYHMIVAKFNSSFTQFEMDTLPFSGFNHTTTWANPRALTEGIDVTNPDSVTIGAAGQIQLTPGWSGPEPNQLFFYSYNLNTGTLNWQKTIERNTGSNWYVQSAYLGGGKSVFVINEYDWNTDPNLHQKVVILIMNEHGDVIGQREFTQSLTPIVLYPNPAIDRIRIKVPSELHPTSYQIISVDGRVVDSGTWESPELTVEHLPAGKYYLKVFEEERLVGLEGFVRP